jgi:hypothetical protein
MILLIKIFASYQQNLQKSNKQKTHPKSIQKILVVHFPRSWLQSNSVKSGVEIVWPLNYARKFSSGQFQIWIIVYQNWLKNDLEFCLSYEVGMVVYYKFEN